MFEEGKPAGPVALRRTLVAAGVTGVLVALGVAVRFGSSEGIGFAVGLAWGLINFLVLAALLRRVGGPGKVDRGGVLRFTAAKFGVYGIGIALLVGGWLPLLALAMEFTWLLVVIVLRAFGSWLLGMTRVVD